MKAFFLSASLGVILIATPVAAAVVLEPMRQVEMAAALAGRDKPVEAGWPVGQSTASPESANPVTIMNDTFTSYASMLPAPADWVLLLTGFGVIGYAMRSRKRTTVSFN